MNRPLHYPEAIQALVAGRDLSDAAAEAVMRQLLEGSLEQAQVAALLTALAAKGESATELSAFARVLRTHMLTIAAPAGAIDPCGTGGSGLPTVNTSTLCAFVLAACGVPVAKHGNRASSGRCGSMDVLEAMGVHIELTPAAAERVLKDQGIVFMYARRHHPALGQVTPVRRALGFRTAFNFLGPICNPASVPYQVLGVSAADRAPLLAQALARLGTQRAMVVHGEDGLDELTLTGESTVWELVSGEVRTYTVAPEDVGVARVSFDAIAGGEPERNVALATALLRGEGDDARTAHTAWNAAAGLIVTGQCSDWPAAYARAYEVLRSGAAWACFERYRDATHTEATR